MRAKGSSPLASVAVKSFGEGSKKSSAYVGLWTPGPKQHSALQFMLARQYAGLFADVGVGKTSITLHLFEILRRKKFAKRLLVLVKASSLYTTWQDEIVKWGLPLKWVVLHGDKKNELIAREHDVAILNYEGLAWFEKLPKKLADKYDMLVLDESTMVKDHTTQRFKSLRRLIDRFTRRYILTGTPASEGLLKLFGQVYIMDGGETFGPYITVYRNNYFMPTGYMGYNWVIQPGASERIYDALSDKVLRVGRGDLPPLAIVDRMVVMPSEARAFYDRIEQDMIGLWKDGLVTAANAAVANQKLRQIANGAVYDEGHVTRRVHESKVEELRSIVEEIEGASLFVLYDYEHDWQAIQGAFPEALHIGKGVSKKETAQLVHEFNAGKIQLLAGQIQSVAYSLNLQADCHHVAFYSLTWSLEKYQQAIGRVWRQGQKKPVSVFRILAQDSVDEDVSHALKEKDGVQQDLFKALESRYSKALARRE